MSLYSRLDRIAADVEKLNRQVNSVANAPQSQRTSVEGGSIDFNDADGNLKAIVGMQDDGGYTTNVVSGPTPPTPANFTVEVDYGKIVVHWGGSFGDALVAPTDWARAEVYAQEGQFVTPSRELARGSMVAASGGEVTVGVLKGQWTVCMAGWSQAGIMSPMSAPVTVEVPGYGDLVQETLDEAQELIDEAKAALEAGQADLAGKITDAEVALAGLQSTLDNLDETTLPALRSDLDAAEGRLDTAEGQITDAFGEIAAIEPGAVNLANKSDLVRGAGPARFLELDVWRFFEGNVGRKVTLSFDLVANADNLQVRVYPYLNSGVSIETTTSVSASTSWQRFTVSTVVADYGAGSNRGSVGFYSESASGLIEMRNVKVEWGPKASAYSPSPADVGADISSAEQSAKSAAKLYADGLKTQIDSTIDTARTELEGDITTAQARADAAFQSAADADSKAVTAKNTADQAKSDAAAAAGIANGKGKVVFGTTAPATADRLPTTLWIDTTSGANTPKRWSGSAWVAVTDKAAVDAANAAATAQSKANEAKTAADQAKATADAAQSAASTAQSTATQALTSANTKNKVTRSTSRPPAVYDGRVDDVWFTMSSMGGGGRVLFQEMWNGNTWVSVTIDSQVIAYLDAAKITTGYLDVAALIKAGAIAASQIAVGDFSNLASVDPIRSINVTRPAYWATKTVGDYATRGDSANNYLMFKDRTDTVPFTNGEALRMTFTAKATVPTDVGGALWAYPTDSNGPGSGSRSVTGDFVSVGTTEQNFTIKIDIPNNWADVIYKSWICGLFPRANTGGDMANVFVRDVRVYRMTGTTLIQNGSITTDKAAANLLEVGNLKAGTAAIAEAVVAKIAAQTASIQQADVKNLFVTGTSSLSDVVAERIAADTAKFIELEVGNLVAGTGTMDTATINKLFTDVVVASMAQAEQFIGENAILTGAVTAPKITASEELWAKIGEFVRIRAEHIEADAIDGMVITGANIRTSATGARVQLDAGGVRVFDDSDNARTQLSPFGNTFKGEVEAETLVVNGGAELKSADNTLAQGAKLTLAAGVTDPTAPPTVQPYWAGIDFDTSDTGTQGVGLRGLAWDGTYYWTTYAGNLPEGQFSAFRINPADGSVKRYYDVSVGNTTNVSEWFGVTCIGSELFWLYRDGYRSFVVVTNLSLVKLREWEYPGLGYSPTNPLVYKPGIGNDGTNIVIAQCSDGGSFGYNIFNKTTGAFISYTNDPGDRTRSNITGVHVGNADWGRKLATVAKSSTSKLPSFSTTTGIFDGVATEFDAAAQGSVGVVFHDGKFHTLDPSGVIHEYAAPNMGDDSGDWWATYRWSVDADNDGTNDSTSRIGPVKRFTWPNRSKLRFLGAPLPVGVGYITPSIARKITTPSRTDFRTPNFRVYVGESQAWYDSLPTDWQSGPAPSGSNDFPTAEPSTLASASSTFQVNGDGSGHWGPLTFGADGSVGGVPKVATGNVTVGTVPANGGKWSTVVTFPPGRFTTTPTVTVITENGRLTPSIEVGTVTAASVQINVFNWTGDVAANTPTMYWSAIEGG